VTQSPPPPVPAVLELSAVVRRGVAGLARRLRGERPEHGVSLAKLSVLGRLYRLGPMSAVDLARRERIQPQSLTRLIAELEQGALIKRRDDETDRRRVLIELTAGGREVLLRDVRQRDAWLALAISSELSGTEQELLRLAAQLMERLADAQSATALRRIAGGSFPAPEDRTTPVPVRQRRVRT
jgi:DNA-binding MarR family transcriptional regulator